MRSDDIDTPVASWRGDLPLDGRGRVLRISLVLVVLFSPILLQNALPRVFGPGTVASYLVVLVLLVVLLSGRRNGRIELFVDRLEVCEQDWLRQPVVRVFPFKSLQRMERRGRMFAVLDDEGRRIDFRAPALLAEDIYDTIRDEVGDGHPRCQFVENGRIER